MSTSKGPSTFLEDFLREVNKSDENGVIPEIILTFNNEALAEKALEAMNDRIQVAPKLLLALPRHPLDTALT